MKKRKKSKGRRFTATAPHPSSRPRMIEVEPEDFVPYLQCAERLVLPHLKETGLGPGPSVFLLAQHAQVLFTGDDRLSIESAMAITTNVLALWQAGYYTPCVEYPYTLQQTLHDMGGSR